MDDIIFYALCLVAIVAGIWIIKKCVSCIVRLAVLACVLALLAYVYFTYIAV